MSFQIPEVLLEMKLEHEYDDISREDLVAIIQTQKMWLQRCSGYVIMHGVSNKELETHIENLQHTESLLQQIVGMLKIAKPGFTCDIETGSCLTKVVDTLQKIRKSRPE